MKELPSEAQLRFMSQPATGLIAAVCDDLPGLLVVGHSIEEVMAEIGDAAHGLIEEMFDGEVAVEVVQAGAPKGFQAHSAIARFHRHKAHTAA